MVVLLVNRFILQKKYRLKQLQKTFPRTDQNILYLTYGKMLPYGETISGLCILQTHGLSVAALRFAGTDIRPEKIRSTGAQALRAAVSKGGIPLVVL